MNLIEYFFNNKFVNKKEKIMQVEIIPGCIACGICESINSEVFTVDEVAHVNEKNIMGNEEDCKEAAKQCPVSVIKVTE
jgi:ferredoxin